jgi:hypothetical protein
MTRMPIENEPSPMAKEGVAEELHGEGGGRYTFACVLGGGG